MDNADHNISMLGGKNTFNGMGIIAISTGESYFRTRIPREKRKSASEAMVDKAIPVKQYLPDGIKALASIKLKAIKDLIYLVAYTSLEKLTSSGE